MKHVKYYLVGLVISVIGMTMMIALFMGALKLPSPFNSQISAILIVLFGISALVVPYNMGKEVYMDFKKDKKSDECTYYDGKKWKNVRYYD